MKVTVIGSSSLGNSYIIDDGYSKLLLDCGLPIAKIQEAADFKLSSFDGCLVSHEHMDHIKAAKDIAKMGVNVYASKGTLDANGLTGHRFIPVSSLKYICTDNYRICPFDLHHDAAEPLGFIIKSMASGEKLVYITDTQYVDYTFKDVDIWMIEANFDDEALRENVNDGLVVRSLKHRIQRNHMSIKNVIDLLKANNTNSAKKVYLLHLSSANSIEKEFKEKVQRLIGCEVIIC